MHFCINQQLIMINACQLVCPNVESRCVKVLRQPEVVVDSQGGVVVALRIFYNI